MTLTLRITNLTSLPDGGPISYTVDGRGFEFGRDSAMDWTLPDPQRFVSSCHGEVKFENGGYWLYDLSTNGTFVNGSAARMKNPYALRTGDRIQVGTYILMVEQADAPASAAQSAALGGGGSTDTADPNDPWRVFDSGPAAPVPGFDPSPPPPRRPDFGDQHISFPGAAHNDRPGPDRAPLPEPVAPKPVAETPQAPPVPRAPSGGDASPFGDIPAAPPPPPGPSGAGPSAPPAGAEPLPAPELPPAVARLSPSIPGAQSGPDVPQMPSARRDADAARVFGAPPGRSVSARPPLETPAAEPVPTPPPPPEPAKAGADAEALLRTLCEGAGLRPDAFAGTDPHATAHEIGRALRIMTAELAALLRVRTTIKTSFRSGSRTEMSADANNPLKFVPSAEEALEVMFGRPRPGYQRGAAAVQASFSDINRHQIAVFSAIQPALAEVLGDLSPETIQDKIEAGPFTNKAAKAWDLYVQRWDAKTAPHENGMLDVFNLYFAKAYDAEVNRKK